MPGLKTFLDQKTALAESYIIETRRYLHSIPELGMQEQRTSAFIKDELVKMGYTPVCGIANTGITADLQFAGPGPCLMIRADMDALPMEEQTGLPFASTHPGCMHACGHDGHVAMVLGAARVMSELAAGNEGKNLRGSIRFLFQPAEEAPGGAEPMIKEGVLDGVDACLACHIWPQVPQGHVGVKPGPLMAAMDRFEIILKGRGGHSSQPHLCTDVLGAAAELALALPREAGNRINPVLPAVLSICKLSAGHTFNVIPQTAALSGCTRAFHKEVCQMWEDEISRVTDGIAKAYGVEYKFNYLPGHGAVDNDPEVTSFVRDAAACVLGEDKVFTPELSLAGEDFSCFQEVVPGCMFFLGSGVEGCKPLHSPEFSFNEKILAKGTGVFCQAALNLLASFKAK